jgi:hypothetical protein
MQKRPSESSLQIDCIRWFDLQYPLYSPYLFHIRNGGSIKSAREGRKFKLMGVRKGVPDLFLSVPNKEYHGLYIEMKKPGGKLSMEQIDTKDKFERMGYEFYVVDSFDDFQKSIKDYLNLL